MAQYGKTSPWGNTEFTNTGELDLLRIRPVPAEDDDILYTIEPQYTYRPDLLAFDLYGTAKLWWIFAQRNIDTLKDVMLMAKNAQAEDDRKNKEIEG